jgi:Ser/Thr protein kinase RdoA (MazF antagonist)
MSASTNTAIDQQRLIAIARQFISRGQVSDVSPLGNGNINSTFLVTVSAAADGSAAEPVCHPSESNEPLASERPFKRFVLQRINTQVFRQPELVVQNMTVLTDHVRHQGQNLPRRWEVPCILPSRSHENFWIENQPIPGKAPKPEYWRAISFIEDAQVFESVASPEHAREIGYGLAMFHRLISSLPAEKLADTLEGFHITPTYLAQYDRVWPEYERANHPTADAGATDVDPRLAFALAFVAQRRDGVAVLETAKAAGALKLRPIHGDPKVNNIMLDAQGKAVSLIDLDTLKPGLVHYDIGDCLRSLCNPLGEETEDWQAVVFDLSLAQATLEGYLSLAQDFLTEQDYDYLYEGIRLIAFELGLRFFTDYLAGNVYFKVKHPTHNLTRALVQFKLTESIEAQATELKAMIQSLRPPTWAE